ncbi:MAG: type II toxin-antitoxin system YafQ family toxin [Candidatus Dadabacteria bacterium]|nr:type II toxin-antitoxin system YafQ family toxin [Candidatus Dadabacteria bacterium]
MRELRTTAQFKRDLRKARKRGKNPDKLRSIIEKLVAGRPLARLNKPHRLLGDWFPCWECHIEPDWLLVWDENEESVTLMRTGTHSDLFK